MNKKAYVVAVDMGYGHQRAAFPLREIAVAPSGWGISGDYIISADSYPGIPKEDKDRWGGSRGVYELISRFRWVPLLGELVFQIMDSFQRIAHFYPRRDLSRESFQLRYMYGLIARGMGKHLISELNKEPLPFIATFFLAAFCAEEHGYAGPIYCVCTDSDISRAWAPKNPRTSRINYFAPSLRVVERLKSYGVRDEKIIFTGFPLPKKISKADIYRRIVRLDPSGVYHKNFKSLITAHLGKQVPVAASDMPHRVTVAFAVGGANAQYQIGLKALSSLALDIRTGKIAMKIVVGTSKKLRNIFDAAITHEGLDPYRGSGVDIVYNADKFEYLSQFNKILADVDVLWTKPSELSFFAALGLPIVIAPPLGSQEEYNSEWLRFYGAGVNQANPSFVSQWLSDWLESGQLAAMAMNGFINLPKEGTHIIEETINSTNNI